MFEFNFGDKMDQMRNSFCGLAFKTFSCSDIPHFYVLL